MKVIIKIDEYLPERNSVVFKTCRLNSHKSIDEFESKVVDCHDLNMTDCETFIESLINKVSNDRIEIQDDQKTNVFAPIDCDVYVKAMPMN